MLNLSARNAVAGAALTASGVVDDQAPGFRLFFDDGAKQRGLVDGVVDRAGRFSTTIHVPKDAEPGAAKVCAMSGGGGRLGLDLTCVALTILPPPPGKITGKLRSRSGAPVAGISVLLRDARGNVVGTATTQADGSYTFPSVPKGQYAIDPDCLTVACAPSAGSSDKFTVPAGGSIDVLHDAQDILDNAPIALPIRAFARSGSIYDSLGFESFPPLGWRSQEARFISFASEEVGTFNIRFQSKVQFSTDFPVTSVGCTVSVNLSGSDDAFLTKQGQISDMVPDRGETTMGSYECFATFNVNELPPGTWYAGIVPRVKGRFGPEIVGISSNAGFRFEMLDFSKRWFNGQGTEPSVSVLPFPLPEYCTATDCALPLIYHYHVTLPRPSFDFNEPLDLSPIPISLDNKLTLGIPVNEYFFTGKHSQFSGDAEAAARVTLLGMEFLNESRGYVGPTGTSLLKSTYALEPIIKDLLSGKQCIPIYEYGKSFDLIVCDVGLSLSIDACLEGQARVDSTIKSNMKVTETVTPEAKFSLHGCANIDVCACDGQACLDPYADIALPLTCDPDRVNVCGFDDPCLRLGITGDWSIDCWVGGKSGDFDLGQIRIGSCNAKSARGARVSQPPILRAHPSVAVDDSGHAMSLWIQNESLILSHPDTRVYFSAYDGQTWSTAQRIEDRTANVRTPKVVFLGQEQALGVWVENDLTQEQGQQLDIASALNRNELRYAFWDGAQWAPSLPLTNDNVVDAKPVLASDPLTGRALLVWLRGGCGSPACDEIKPFYAVFDGRDWSNPAPLPVPATGTDFQVTAAFGSDGIAMAVWVHDGDGNRQTRQDRQLLTANFDGTTWTQPQQVPGLPYGGDAPAIAFSRGNEPLLTFVVAPIDPGTGLPGSADGNNSKLFAAYRRGRTWEVGPVGEDTHAEQPVVAVGRDNRAVIAYRQFDSRNKIHISGDSAVAIADLSRPRLQWSTGYLTADGLTNWDTTLAVDRNSGRHFISNVKRKDAGSSALIAHASLRERAGTAMITGAVANGNDTVAMMEIEDLPDLLIPTEDLNVSNTHPVVGDTVTLAATLRNAGVKPIPKSSDVDVSFYDIDPVTGSALLLARRSLREALPSDADALSFNGEVSVSAPYLVRQGGLHTIRVVADEADLLGEAVETNNQAELTFGRPPAPTDPTGMADSGAQRLELRWHAVESGGIAGYRVYRSEVAGQDYEFVGGGQDARFVDELANSGVTYRYVIATIDVYGELSELSQATTLTLHALCAGDCGNDGEVSIDELVTMLNVALGNADVSVCGAGDANSDGEITVDELITAVSSALVGCSDNS